MRNSISLFSMARIYCRNGLSVVLMDRVIFLIDIVLATSITFLMQFLIWKFLYTQREESSIHGLSFSSLLSYYLYVICLNRFNNGYSVIDDLSFQIHSGRIELGLIKPLYYPLQRLFDYLGGSLAYLPLAIIPVLWGFYTSAHALGLNDFLFVLNYLALLLLSQVLCFFIAFLVGQVTFKTEKRGLTLALYSSLAAFFGGVLLPAKFWPESFIILMESNPFYYTMGAIADYASTRNLVDLQTTYMGLTAYLIIFGSLSYFSWKRLTHDYKGLGG